MSDAGSNLPDFKAVQLDFAAHIRNPDVNPAPVDIEPRRMKIYIELFYNNIKSFLDSAFPIAREVVGEDLWRVLVREFVHRHPSESPYFLQISQEFLTFLNHQTSMELPDFLLELCHYEWVELSLDVAIDTTPECALATPDPDKPDFLMGELLVSSLVRALVYKYPVHELGIANQPRVAPDVHTYLLVYRNDQEQVRFVVSSPVTHRLLALLEQGTAKQALSVISDELRSAGRQVTLTQMVDQGRQTLLHFFELGIIRGEIV